MMNEISAKVRAAGVVGGGDDEARHGERLRGMIGGLLKAELVLRVEVAGQDVEEWRVTDAQTDALDAVSAGQTATDATDEGPDFSKFF